MQRHTKKLMKKARACKVSLTQHTGLFSVKSPSGSEYFVEYLAEGNKDLHILRCGCKWCEYHQDRVCAHKLAVELWCAESGFETISAWSTHQDAKRQHRHIERVQDVFVTYRKAA